MELYLISFFDSDGNLLESLRVRSCFKNNVLSFAEKELRMHQIRSFGYFSYTVELIEN
jgi:hypothetical protein